MINSCLFLKQCSPRAQRSQASSIDFLPCCAQISQESLKVLMILCTADDESSKSLQFCAEEHYSEIGTLHV